MNSYPQQSFSPDDENRGSIVDTLGKIALGAGTLAAGVAGYRRLKGLDTKTGRRVNTISEEDLRKPATTKTSPGDPRYDNVRRAAQGVPNITTGAVDPAPAPLSSLERYRNLEKLTRTARDERMPGTLADLSKIAQTSASAAAGLSAVPQVAKPARQTPRVSSGPEQIVPQGEFNTIEIPDQVDRLIDSLGQELELNRQQRILRGIEGREIGLGKNILAGFRREAREAAEAAKNTPAKTFLASKLASEGYIDTSVTRQQANAPQVSLQSAEAVDTGIDQAVQRNKVAAQRDHDRDLSQLEVLEDIAEQNEQLMRREATPDQMIGYEPDAAVKSAIAQQPGGALRDQTDTSLGQSSISTGIKLLPSAAVSAREKSQQFLQQRFEELGATIPSPTRRQRVLSADPELAEAYELYASTGDPSVLSRLSETPSSPVSVTLREQSEFVSPEVPTKSLYKSGVYPEYVGDLVEKDIELTNQISSLSQEKLNIAARQKELGEQELILKNAMAQEPAGRDSYSRMLGKVKYEQQNLPAPESLNVDIGDAMAERDFTRVQLKAAEDLGPSYKLTPREEGTRAFYEQTPEGKIIPETLEVRGGRPSIELEAKGGQGRRVAEYDPSGQTGSRKGPYGIESTKYPQATSAQRPTQYTTNELVQEALEQSSASPEGDVPIPPPEDRVSRIYGPKASQKPLEASEKIRRIRATNSPERAQSLVAKYLRDLQGI